MYDMVTWYPCIKNQNNYDIYRALDISVFIFSVLFQRFVFPFVCFSFCSDLPRQAAAHEGDLPAHQRAAVAISADEVGHRRGHDPRGPLERFQPAVRDVCSGETKRC